MYLLNEFLHMFVVIFVRVVYEHINPVLWVVQTVDAVEKLLQKWSGALDEEAEGHLGKIPSALAMLTKLRGAAN